MHRERPYLALGWMSFAALGFASVGIFVKRLSPSIPGFEIVFFRSLINFVVVALIMLARREKFFPRGQRILWFRGAAGFGGMSCLFYALAHLPLPLALMLSWSSPLFVILFSALFLRERVGSRALVWIASAFIGLALILLPGLELGLRSRWMLAGLIGLLGAAFSGAAYVAVRAAASKVGVYTIVLYLTGVSTLLSAPFMWLQGVVDFNSRQAVELLAIGLLATAAQLAMTEAYRLARASVVSPMSLLTAAFGALFGWLLFDERLAATQWIGMAVLAASLIVLTRQSRLTQ